MKLSPRRDRTRTPMTPRPIFNKLTKPLELINPKVLIALCRDSGAARRLRKEAEALESFELRCILKIVSGFFLEMQKGLLSASPAPESAIEDLILRAYRAQMICSNWQAEMLNSFPVEAVGEKSVLPFHVIHHIAAWSGGQRVSEALVTSIGEGFSLLDDLVDLSKDLADGRANSMLLRREFGRGRELDTTTHYEKTIAFLVEDDLSEAAKKFCWALREMLNDLDPHEGLGLSLLTYTRSWLSQSQDVTVDGT